MRTTRRSLAGTLCLLLAAILPPTAIAQVDQDATTTAPGEVTVVENLVFATGNRWDTTPELKLDVYLPAGHGADTPMVIFLPGYGQSRLMFVPVARELVGRGVSVFFADYPSMGPEEAFVDNAAGARAHAESVACAVRFARGSLYGSESAPLILAGFSLGGGLASQVALSSESFDGIWAAYAEGGGGPPQQLDCTLSDASTHVDALVGIGGGYDSHTGYEGLTPYGKAFHEQREPDHWAFLQGIIGLHPEVRVRLLHGDADGAIPFENSVIFETLLTEAGYEVELIEFEGGHFVPVDLVVETVMDLVAG